MNKTAIKNFAIWARRKLISDITYKAGMLGITENGIAQPLPQSTRDLQFFDIGTKDYAEVSGVAIEQRNALIKTIHDKERGSDYKTAFQNVVEEVAYTWFNRLIAVRFMEVNDYLPSRIRVLSSENAGKLEPDFVTFPFDTDLDFTPYEKDLVFQLKDENKLDELFRLLFIKQCNKLNQILPGLFEQISDYTELLLNISFTDKDGIVYHLTHDISEDDFNVEKEGQVEIIGWMYQYYNTEPKDEVFALLKKNVKITKERIPAATQLFTPDWIVRYMVENSLGRLWVEGHPNEQIKKNWKYYLEEAEQEPEVVEQLKKIREEYSKINPVDIKVIDPCMGSGHILVYAFDVLMQIYTSQGYVERDAAKSILINNLYGIDIDVRAYQLAYFAVMMKARQYNRKIFSEHIMPNLIAIRNPENISKSVLKRLGGMEPLGLRLVEDFEDVEEYGSILQVNYTEDELQRLEKQLVEIDEMSSYGNLLVQMETAECIKLVWPLIKQARLLAQKYEVVVTNPPYIGRKGMSSVLSGYLDEHYNEGKMDTFAAFILKCNAFTRENGFFSMMTPFVWMTLSSFEGLRFRMLYSCSLVCYLQPEENSFKDAAVSICAFSAQKIKDCDYIGKYIKLSDYKDVALQHEEVQRIASGASSNYIFMANMYKFRNLPGSKYLFWASDKITDIFLNMPDLGSVCATRQGMATTNNDLFLRLWYEVSIKKIGFNCSSQDEAFDTGMKWFPFNKGGGFRKWYGNNEYLVNYENKGQTICDYIDNTPGARVKSSGRVINRQYYFLPCITWSDICGSTFAARDCGKGFIFSIKGSSGFSSNNLHYYILALLNSYVSVKVLNMINPSVTTNVGDVKQIPFALGADIMVSSVKSLAIECVQLCKDDWDALETSWDYAKHPLIPRLSLGSETTFIDNSGELGSLTCTSWRLSDCYDIWADECQKRFDQLKSNEEKLNRIFIDIYGLQDELTPEVVDKDVTVQKADLGRDIRSLISYAVGCMFGRYSLDVPGLTYAGGEWDVSRYTSFVPDADNCIPITDEEYFTDDIVGRLVEFVRVAYGAETLEENLDFVAAALGNKGNTSREVIRNYFLNDFYKDHLKIYQKRPIYWLFDSGKQNGFKALVYMHRWNADTVGNLRIEYLHKMQTVYEHEIETCQEMIDHGSGHDVAVASRRKEKLIKQLKECKDYDALVAHIAFSKINIDLDDGVKVNYRKVQTGADGKFCEILANSKDVMAKEK